MVDHWERYWAPLKDSSMGMYLGQAMAQHLVKLMVDHWGRHWVKSKDSLMVIYLARD